ncbi:hypothetical protein MTO96_024826 [Rhipicephalus appendiculatus]
MKVIVAGTEITPKELEASEWLTQVNKSREARTSKGTTIPPASDTQDGRYSSHKTSNASNDDTAATDRSLTPRQRGRRLALNSVASKQPRLPSDALKLIVRPRGGLLLSEDHQLYTIRSGLHCSKLPQRPQFAAKTSFK